MFIVLLKFAKNRAKAKDLMAAHNEWIGRGFRDGVFLLTGSLMQGQGGMVLAHDISLAELTLRIGEDPFVAGEVVEPEILEVSPSRADERLRFLA